VRDVYFPSPEVQLQLVEARGPNEFDGAFAAMATGRLGALLVAADSMLVLHRTRLAALAASSRLSAAYGWREHVEAGGLMSYGPSLRDLFRRSATFVDRILKGAKPADLPSAHQVRVGDQSQDRESARAHDPAVAAVADQVIK
jgi:putative ABC transport system substrate-binding protein